MSDDARYIG